MNQGFYATSCLGNTSRSAAALSRKKNRRIVKINAVPETFFLITRINNDKIKKGTVIYLKLSELISVRDLFLFKFNSNRQRLETLRGGELYMNTVKYFIDLEKQSGKKGMGDIDEVSHIMQLENVRMYDEETGKLVFAFDGPVKTQLRPNHALTKHAFCSFAVSTDMIEVVSQEGDKVTCRFAFTEEQLQQMKDEFGEHVLVLDFSHFMDRVKKSFDQQKIAFVADRVKYQDFSVNYSDRINAFAEDNAGIYFYKDIFFEHQSEFRIVALSHQSDVALRVQVPSFEDISAITESKSLLNYEMVLTLVDRE